MGTNEKHGATYHGLSDDTVRGRYCDGTHAQTGHTTDGAEYDTWLAGVKAEAKREALNESATYAVEWVGIVGDGALVDLKTESEYDDTAEWLRARANQYKENQ